MKKVLIVLAFVIVILSLLFVSPLRNPFVIKDNSYNIIPVTERINASEIEIKPDKIVIDIKNLSISRYANTSSMNPMITENSKGITVVPKSPDEITIGDIITYEQNGILIVHRVIETGHDDYGWYCIVKGDNTQQADGKIRFGQIKSILIGILY